MDIARLRKIIRYSTLNRRDIELKVKRFYSFIGINNDNEVLNVLQVVRNSFFKKGYLVLEMPFADEEIGALTYKGDALGYILVNTSRPKVNVNFAICHEIYHVFFQEEAFCSRIEFSDTHYYGREAEYAANLFAGMLLMPEISFRNMYHKFYKEAGSQQFDTLLQLMHYYKVPYMAVLVRCLELELIESDSLGVEYLQVSSDTIKKRLLELWLDANILEASDKDDFPILENVVKMFGKEYIDKHYINQRTLDMVLKNIRTLYLEIKGE